MAQILSDAELKAVLGTIIVDGDPECIRPNSYVLRIGESGEFLNTGKEFSLGKAKKGIRVPPGHSVGVTSHESVDFRRDTVRKIFPDQDLHGLISPTTDLSREGIVAPTTQIDAGYFGTPNWTLTNTSSEERRFVHRERIFRLTIFRLQEGETPQEVYKGDYQGQTGYVRSERKGAPIGMKDSDWEDSYVKGGPEDLLETLIRSGYPWHVLGQRLKIIDQQFKSVTDEYADIRDSIEKLTKDVTQIRESQGDVPDTIRKVVRDEATALQNRWLVGAGAMLLGTIGLTLSATSNKVVFEFLRDHGVWVGLGLVVIAVAATYLISRRN